MKFTTLIIIAFNITSCTNWAEVAHDNNTAEVNRLSEEARQRDSNPNQYNYQLGLKDGCDSGNLAGGSVTGRQAKNVDLYINNAYYKNGYDDAYSKCKNESDQLNRAITESLNRGW